MSQLICWHGLRGFVAHRYILGLCKKIKKAGCTVLLVQKSILRDAVNDLSLHFLAKMGIMVIKDVERTDVEFICRTVGCRSVTVEMMPIKRILK